MNLALVYLDALAGGGYPRDVRWLAGALADTETSVRLVADKGSNVDGLGSATVLSPDEFRSSAHEFDVVHLWGMFAPSAFLLCRGRWRSGRFVITPACSTRASNSAETKITREPQNACSGIWR